MEKTSVSEAIARDPKVNPQAGDVLRKGMLTVTVEGRWKGGSVAMETTIKGVRSTPNQSLDVFRKWAATAEVIHRAEDTNA